MRKIDTGVIHCAATPNGQPVLVEALRAEHKAKGWRDIGYHFVIEITGVVRLGRPIEEVGAHVEGYNQTSIGVCMIGTDKFSTSQWASLKTLVNKLNGTFSHMIWKGHRDFSPDLNHNGTIERCEWIKICPGFDVTDWLVSDKTPKQENIL